jgi:hypothetical protein
MTYQIARPHEPVPGGRLAAWHGMQDASLAATGIEPRKELTGVPPRWASRTPWAALATSR